MIFKTFEIRGKNSATFVASKCDIKRTFAYYAFGLTYYGGQD